MTNSEINNNLFERIIIELIFFSIIICCGSVIKRTIKEEYPEVYIEAMRTAPWYLKIGEKII